ncbi:hypothetical protein DFP83_10260 [Idiomarina fontislapidosi]|uniref:DUF2989 domain-containing protein n=1 Tax=Idiomarina fontislapidosi TaxID=263723 RepID=A0A432Y9S9_9GAMM|nr:DUF2989 domain-containing protein [Idiomarina fontislapidosi]PYE34319.1 hypothetical protein DFP83_10260 [Idiomarina fontislapidosi]RUO57718.1 DUF2989 domain-containing protein [Idiomarina fontislapidosi]
MTYVRSIGLNAVIATVFFTLSGCEQRPITVREACEALPDICSDLNQDNWCNAERRQLILTRYANETDESPAHQYYLLKDLQSYSQCIELASSIEHRKLKAKQSHRIEAYINSLNNIEKLAKQTRDSEHPLLLYWHWANRSDMDALDRLLELEGKAIMQTSELQFALATYYAKEDNAKMLDYLYRSLRLYTPEQRFNVEIPESLVTHYLNSQLVDEAYIWALVAIHFESEVLKMDNLHHIFMQKDERKQSLAQLAEIIIEQIEEGQFNLKSDWSVPTN